MSLIAKEIAMPYASVADLPKAQTDQYNAHQKEAFLKAFNHALDEKPFRLVLPVMIRSV